MIERMQYPMLYRTVLICLATITGLAHQACPGAEPKEHGLILSSRIATDGDFLTLPVKVGEQWRTFMVDTGAPVTTLDALLIKELQKADRAMRARVPLQERIPNLYIPPKMIVKGTTTGEIEFPAECAVMSADLSRARAGSEQPIVGILGMDLLERYAMELDLEGGTLRLLDSESLPAAKHDASLEIVMRDRRPCLPVGSRGVEFWALLDTGALLSLGIERDVYDRLVDREELWRFPFEVEFEGQKRMGLATEGLLREFKVGPFTHYLLKVKDHEPVSLLGVYYWRRYRCVFDFPKKQVYLDKGPLFDVSDDSHHAGIYLDIAAGDEKVWVVTHIIKGCQAERSGVCIGDRLIQVDGAAVEPHLCAQTIYRRMSFHHNRPCELRLVRDGKEFQVTLPATGFQPKAGEKRTVSGPD